MIKMNKIKFLYDVVKTMRAKDALQGVAIIEVQKDQGQIFYVKNEFQKNLLTMQTKASIHTEINYEGKEVKHQSTTEFTNHCAHHGMSHKGFKPLHHLGGRCGGIKEKLNKIGFALRLLNDIQVAEQENQTTLITLELPEIPEEIKALLQEKMHQVDSCHDHSRCCFAKELFTIETGKFSSAMTVNKEYEVQKIVITFDGIQNNAENEQHVLNIIGELQLN